MPDDVMELLGGLQSADGIFCVNRNQRIIHWSPSAEQILGHPAHEVLGRFCYDVLGAGTRRTTASAAPTAPSSPMPAAVD
ncbi:MAG: hypothetical protein A2W34_04825 [Chloroflexi bacterium RBG_16_64_32]|nr:MAG: hypothetical protein A2W34_04825 [Chloroflexi bacterium RBG_16_64_32]